MTVPTDIPSNSPKWGPTLKLVIGLTFVAILAALLIRFRNIVGPLLMALILSYVLHPLANWLSNSTRLSWRASVNVIYLIMILALVGFFTATGVALVQQVNSLYNIVRNFVENDLIQLVTDLSVQRFILFGVITVDMNQIFGQTDVQSLVNQALGVVQPALGQAGGLLSALATSTFSGLGWGFFILVVSYFMLADAGQVPDLVAKVEIPGYDQDFRRLGRRLGRIWNAFMRGQLTIIAMTIISYLFLLSVFGVRNALALALLTGAARLVPYIGPLINWMTIGVVAFFQSTNYLGLEQWQFVLLVLISGIILDQIFDNIISPRVYSSALNVHPAAVLVTAIIAANLLGFIGLLLAAPVLATLALFVKYAIRKMLDLDPWPEDEKQEQSGIFTISAIRRWIARLQSYLNKKRAGSSQEINPK